MDKPFHYRSPKRMVSFYPEKGNPCKTINPGAMKKRLNPWSQSKPEDVKGLQSGRILLGFNIEGKQAKFIDELVEMVKSIRQAQTSREELPQGKADVTFIMQRGLYTYQSGPKKGLVEDEEGCQIVFLNFGPEKKMEFEVNLRDLAEKIAVDYHQELVVLEMQEGGIPYTSYLLSYKEID